MKHLVMVIEDEEAISDRPVLFDIVPAVNYDFMVVHGNLRVGGEQKRCHLAFPFELVPLLGSGDDVEVFRTMHLTNELNPVLVYYLYTPSELGVIVGKRGS